MGTSDWYVRYADPDRDARAISEIFQQSFGDNYGFPNLLEEEGVRSYIDKESVLCYIAETENDSFKEDEKVFGVGMTIFETERKVEFGRAAILPSYRRLRKEGMFAIEYMMDVAMDDIEESEAEITYTRSVTHTGAIQKMFEKYGFSSLVYEESKVPAVRGNGREDTVLMVRLEDDNHPESVYIPSGCKYDDLLYFAGEQLDIEQRWSAHIGKQYDGTGLGIRIEQMSTGSSEKTIRIDNAGNNPYKEVLETVDRVLNDDSLDSIDIHLGVGNQNSSSMIPDLLDRSFRINGFIPGWLETERNTENALFLSKAVENDREVIMTESTMQLRNYLDQM